MSGFQSTVNVYNTLGFVGDLAFDGPIRAGSYNLYSNGTPNIIGYAYTSTNGIAPEPAGAAPNAATATVGGTGVFAGILINSKEYPLRGTTAGGPLANSLVLPDYAIGDLLVMGEVFVDLPGPANVGDLVTYDSVTGALNSITPTVAFTASIAAGGSAGVNDVMTVSALTAGQISIGMLVSGAGVAGGTFVSSLGTGKGYTGTYNLTSINEQTVSSEAMTGNNIPSPAWAASSAYITTSAGVDTLHITTLTSGEIVLGSAVLGVGVAANTVITAYGSGVGGTGTYTLNTSGQTVFSSGTPGALTGNLNILIPRCTVTRYASNTLGGVAAIKLTN